MAGVRCNAQDVQFFLEPFADARDIAQIGAHRFAIVHGGDGSYQCGEIYREGGSSSSQRVQGIALGNHRAEAQAREACDL